MQPQGRLIFRDGLRHPVQQEQGAAPIVVRHDGVGIQPQGDFVMPDGLGHPARPGQGIAQVNAGHKMIRFEAQGGSIFAHCLLGVPPQQGVAQIEAGWGKVRRQLQCLLILGNGFGDAVDLGQGATEIVIRLKIFRIIARGLLTLHGLLHPVRLDQGVAQAEMRAGAGGHFATVSPQMASSLR